MTTTNERDAMAASFPGRVFTPSSPYWDEARAAWQLRADQHPALVVEAASGEDVAEAVRTARANGLRVALQNTGHGAAPIGNLDGVVLVRTRGLRELRVDPEARVFRAGAGVMWEDAVRAASSHGLVALAGSAGDVGIVGYTLGGGLSWLSRRYGFAANDVVDFEVVTADGVLRRVDAENDPDLFWALRGGGGNFAAVVSVSLRLHDCEHLGAGLLAWPQERAPEVMARYLDWVGTVPDEMASCVRLMNVPDVPDTPELVRGRNLVLVEVVHQGVDVDELVAPLRALAPEIDTIGPATPEDLLQLHMDPPVPMPVVGDGAVLASVTKETWAALLATAGAGTGSPLLSLEVRHLGGKLARPSPDNGCLADVRGDFVLFAVGVAPDDEAAAALRARIASLHTALAPWRAPRDLVNYREVRNEPVRFFGRDTLDRLRAVKERYDPDHVFVANHRLFE